MVSTILHAVLTIVVFLTMLIALVAAHEFGHYVFARLFGMACEEFALGMGGKPWIWARRRYIVPVEPGQDPFKRGAANALESGSSTVEAKVEETSQGTILHETTIFTIRPLPIGGFVRIKGMMPEDDGGETQIPGGFFSKAPWKRWIVLAAGPAFSVLAGILVLIPMLTLYGIDQPTGRAVVGDVVPKGPAAKAGLQAGDRFVSVDGVKTSTWFDVTVNVRDKGERPITLVIDRKGKTLTKVVKGLVEKTPSEVVDAKGESTGILRRQTRLQILAESEIKPLPFGKAAIGAIKMPWITVRELVNRFSKPAELAENVGGPGTMIKVTSDSVNEGAWAVVRTAGLLSISVGIFNLLPFPPLDGGQMWIAFVEMLRGGRRLSLRTQETALKFGFAMVLMLVVTVLFIDARRLTGASDPPTTTRSVEKK